VSQRSPALDDARRLHARGVELAALGRPGPALGQYGRAMVAVGDDSTPIADRLRGRVWLSSAMSEGELNRPSAAAESLRQASAAAARAGDDELAVLVHAQRGAILMRVGDFGGAATELDVALDGQPALTDYDQCLLLLNRGTLALFAGELRTAQMHLPRAVRIALRHGFDLEALKGTHNLAYVHFLAGDLPAALRGMDDALALMPALGSGIPLLDRARVLAEAGLVSEADKTLAEATTVFRRDRLGQDLGETELERARCALLAGDAEGARRLAMRARDRFRRRGNDRWRRSAELVLLQGDLAAGRPGRRLSGPALRLRHEFERDGVRLPAQTAALIAAEAHLAAGQPDAARAAVRGAGTVGRRDPITARLHSSYVRARLDAETGHPASAARRAQRALGELAAYQASFGSIDLATAAAIHGRSLADLDLSIALRSGRADIVLAAAERGRAVASRLAAIRPPDDPAAAELLSELRQTVEALRAVEFDRAAAAPLHKRRQELEAQIAARTWTRAGSGIVRDPVLVDELTGTLADATLISFARSNGGLHAVQVSSRGQSLAHLGTGTVVDEQVRRVRADLDVLADPRLPIPLRGSVAASLDRSLAALDQVLLEPLHADGRVVIVTTGLLGQLPWGMLPSLRGVPVVVAPSATAWHAAHTRAPSGHRHVVAVAGPDLGRGSGEAEAVGRTWAARLLTGPAATGAAVAQAFGSARIAHVAAHGVHQTENPLFSSLRLADGPLFAHELDQTARTPDHVVLSACELGLATIRPGDEALGLTSVLLHLGTASVVAGVARVGDEAAAQVMADYHARLARGQDSSLALADALTDRPVPFVCFGAAYHPDKRG
jgi:tetratricopeptide (TPR) repeat protein